MTQQTPFVTPFVSVRDFGAVPDDDSAAARTTNSEAFKQAMQSMHNDLNPLGHPLFVPSGAYYLAESLHITKSVVLFGTGMRGESVLVLPPCCSIIIDPPDNNAPEFTGTDCVIRDLQIRSEERWKYLLEQDWTQDALPCPGGNQPARFLTRPNIDTVALSEASWGTPGIGMRARATIQSVYIDGFTGTAIEIFGDETADVLSDCSYWRVHDVYIAHCGGHGIHTDGGDANGGLCTGAWILGIGGNGVQESSEGGNTYVGCYVYESHGRGYHADNGPSGGVGQATFVGCWSEAPHPSRLGAGGAVWIGGNAANFTEDSTAFMVEGYAHVRPFEVRNLKNDDLRLYIGYTGGPTDLMGWQDKDGGDFLLVRLDEARHLWATEDGTLGLDNLSRRIASYVTASGHPRGPWLQGVPELLLGGPIGQDIKVSTTATMGTNSALFTGNRGDIVLNASPAANGYIGWVCVSDDIRSPARWKRFGRIEA